MSVRKTASKISRILAVLSRKNIFLPFGCKATAGWLYAAAMRFDGKPAGTETSLETMWTFLDKWLEKNERTTPIRPGPMLTFKPYQPSREMLEVHQRVREARV